MKNIVFITNDNYILPTVVAIRTIIRSARNPACINFYVLGDTLSRHSINLLNGINHTQLTIIPSEHLIAQYANVNIDRHVSTSALLKFFIPIIFADLDKILYLDSDIIVQADLSDLYDTPINDVYGAVAKDTLCVLNREYMNEVQIHNDFYFNSGVMLLNLAKMRDDNITEKMLDYRQNVKQHFMDQDTFNAIIGHKVKYVSYRYNFLNCWLESMNISQLTDFFQEQLPQNLPDLYKSCVILHLGGREKPWNTTLPLLTDMYLPLAKEIGWHPNVYTVRQLKRKRSWYKFLHKFCCGRLREIYRKKYKSITIPKQRGCK